MGGKPAGIRIGHLKILDHLVLGMSAFRQREKQLVHSDLVPVPMNSWDQVCDGLRQGDIQGAFIPLPMAMDLHASGFSLECLMFAHRSGSMIIKNKTRTNISSFKNKTFLIPSELSVQHMLFHRLLEASGIRFGPESTSDVAMQVTPPFLMPQIMESDGDGDIGGYMAAEPFGTLAVNRGFGDLFCTSASLWKDHPCCAFVLEKELARESFPAMEELIRHFFHSARLLEEQIAAGEESWEMDWMLDFLEQEESIVLKALYESRISFDPPKLVPDPGIIDMIQTYMVEVMGILSGKIDLDDFLNPTWALNAVSEVTIEN